jgi:hypothetical protein
MVKSIIDIKEILEKVFLWVKQKKDLNKDYKENFAYLNSLLDDDTLDVLKCFYNKNTNVFKSSIIIPDCRAKGVNSLILNEILIFIGQFDEMGGYSFKNQPFKLKDEYRLILNKIMKSRRKSYVKTYILNNI